MQCYTKRGNWSACKPFCHPGVDPFDLDRRPWICEALGRRAPGVEKTETCNPGRAGSEFWSGKELFSGDALSEEDCWAECQQKVGCAGWAWDAGGGWYSSCLLATSVTPPNGAAVSGSACRLSTIDLPRVCSASGQDCLRTHCCSTFGEQCFQKDEQTAFCEAVCTDGKACKQLGPKFCPRCRSLARSKPALVLATFERDMCKALLLVKSITKHDRNRVLGDFNLLWVSKESPRTSKAEIQQMRREVEKTRHFKILDFSRELQDPSSECLVWKAGECITWMRGWHAQMALKLKIATILDSEYYVLLDSKNTFFSDVDEHTFFTPCNEAKSWVEHQFGDIPEPHKSWYRKSASFLQWTELESTWLPASITPALMKRQLVLDMLEFIGEGTSPYKVCDGPLCKMFGMEATEFTLYNIFALKRDTKCKEILHTPDEAQRPWSVALWRVSPFVNLEKCEALARSSVLPLTFGVQSHSLEIIDTLAVTKQERNELWDRMKACLAKLYGRNGFHNASTASPSTLLTCIA